MITMTRQPTIELPAEQVEHYSPPQCVFTAALAYRLNVERSRRLMADAPSAGPTGN